MESFVQWAIRDKWLQGAKSLLTSAATQVAFQSTSVRKQTIFLENVLKVVSEIEDLKQRRNFSITLVEDILTKRPFTKYVAFLLLAGNSASLYGESSGFSSWFDLIKLSRECLKNLTAEDLKQMRIVV